MAENRHQLSDATYLLGCRCGWRGPLEQVEVLGAKDYQVICPRCYGHFVAVECRTQTTLEFEE